MPADVGRERAVAFPERRDHGVPARSGVGEAVQEDDIARHQLRIMTATDTYLLLRAFCDELARCGMEHACTSPGSRCTPIVLSLAREDRIRCWSHIDERCAGFFALGAAKRSGRPVAVTCTSGTAAANLAPAVIEARACARAADRADRRPPAGAPRRRRRPDDRPAQAVRRRGQVVLRGRRARGDAGGLRFMRTLACRAYWTAAEGPPGPVHLNFPLREPLVLDRPLPLPDDATGRGGGRPYVVFDTAARRARRSGRHRPRPARIVIVAGQDRDERPRAGWPASPRAGIPLLADPLSGARHGPAAIAHYDLLLRDPEFARAHRPQFVHPHRRSAHVQAAAGVAGGPRRRPRSRSIRTAPGTTRTPSSGCGSMAHVGPLLGDSTSSIPTAAGSRRGAHADDAVAGAIERTLGDELSEPLVARSLGEWLAARGDAVRRVVDADPRRRGVLPAREAAPRVLSNRGANGIDGTVSSAFGAAAAGDGPVVLLIGDVALAHDIGGLLAASRLGLALTIVLLNNDGGGIFHFLPVAGETDAFEEHVATPHGLDFARAAALYGLRLPPAGHAGRAPRRGRARRSPPRHHDHRGAHRPRAEPGAPPPRRRGGAGRAPALSARASRSRRLSQTAPAAAPRA